MAATRLDALFDEAVPRVLGGSQAVERAPTDGDARWGISANLRPAAAGAAILDALTDDVLALTGAGHWATGAAGSSHLTVRTLEPFRSAVAADDAAVARYAAALARAAARMDPVVVRMRLGLAPNCVLAADEACPEMVELAAAFAAELGEDAWYHRVRVRDLWNATLVHFGGTLADAAALVEWVDARRDEPPVEIVCDTAQIIHWRFGDGVIHPQVLAEVPLSC